MYSVHINNEVNVNNFYFLIKKYNDAEEIPIEEFTIDNESNINLIQAKANDILNNTPVVQDNVVGSFFYDLKRRVLAQEYRLTDTASLDVNFEFYHILLKDAQKWKSKQPLTRGQSLSEDEKEKIQETCRYNDFARLLITNPPLQEQFFRWCIKYQMSASVFIEFPYYQSEIEKKSLLLRELGFYKSQHLKVIKIEVEEGIFKTDLVLLIDQKGPQSILNFQREIVLNDDSKISVKSFFNELKDKLNRPNEITLFKNGWRKWNPYNFIQQVPASTTTTGWWENLPVIQELNPTELEKKYHIKPSELQKKNESQWIAIIKVATSSSELDFSPSHAFIELGIPSNPNSYKMYNFGLYPNHFSNGIWERSGEGSETYDAVVSYPDNCFFNIATQQDYFVITLSPQEGRLGIENIRNSILEGMRKNLAYQRLVHNCAAWAIEHIQDMTENRIDLSPLFKIPYTKLQPKGWKGNLVNSINKLPPKIQEIAILTIHYGLGSKKGKFIEKNGEKQFISLEKKLKENNFNIYLPHLISYLQKYKSLPKQFSQEVTFKLLEETRTISSLKSNL